MRAYACVLCMLACSICGCVCGCARTSARARAFEEKGPYLDEQLWELERHIRGAFHVSANNRQRPRNMRRCIDSYHAAYNKSYKTHQNLATNGMQCGTHNVTQFTSKRNMQHAMLHRQSIMPQADACVSIARLGCSEEPAHCAAALEPANAQAAAIGQTGSSALSRLPLSEYPR